MKVVNVITPHFPPEITAAAYRLDALVGTMSSEYKVNVFTLTEIGQKAQRSEVQLSDNITVYYTNLPRYSKSLFVIRALFECWYACRLAWKASRFPCDLSFATSPYMFLIPAVILFGGRSPKMMDVRDLVWCYLPERNLLQRKVKAAFTAMVKYFLKKYDSITVTNPSEEKWIRDEAGYPVDRIRIIRNGISEEKFKRLSSIKYFQPTNPFVITYIGNIGNGQDLKPLMDAVKNLPDVKLNLIGDGIEMADFRKKIRKEKLRNVQLHGKLKWSRVLPFYQTSTVLFARLGKNYSSAIPSKLFEYLSTGLPVIFHGNGEAARLLKGFQNTFILESDDPEALGQLLQKLQLLELTRSFDNILRVEALFLRERINEEILPLMASLIGNETGQPDTGLNPEFVLHEEMAGLES